MSYALFLGFTSIPLSKHQEFQKNISNLFENVLPQAPETSHLYKPNFFLLFGDYDLLTMAFVDDAEFALRSFTPYNPRFRSSNNAPFDHQVLLSLGVHEDAGIDIRLFERTLQASPLVSVIRIKLSTYLLAAYGKSFKQEVLTRLKEELKKHGHENWIITETFSWNEITLVVFSEQYGSIFNFLADIRAIRIDEISTNLRSLRYASAGIVKINHPVVKNTHTTFGFYHGYDHPDKINLTPVTSILTKGDSFKNVLLDFKNEYKNISKKFNVRLGIGNSDIVLVPKSELQPTLADVVSIFELATKKRSDEILNIRSVIVDEKPNCNPSKQDFPKDFQEKLLISQEDIDEVVGKLKRAGFCKIERDAILNLLSEFNCAVKDTYLYGYFLDLHPFVIGLIKKLKDNTSKTNFYKDISQRHIHLQQIIESFSIAYNNRFLQSFVMNDITDNNLFFKGGVQNLISSYSVVQSVMNALTGLQPKFIYVHGNSDIVSTTSGIGLNYIHLIQPLLVIQHIIYENMIQKVTNILEGEEFSRKVDQYQDSSKFLTYSEVKSSITNLVSSKTEQYFLPILKNRDELNEFNDALSDNLTSVYFNFITEDRDLLSHFVTDYIMYHLLFNSDIDLMEYIYWGIFASNPSTTSGLNSYHRDHFYQFYIRIHLLEKAIEKSPRDNIAMSFMPSDKWRNLLDIIDEVKRSDIFDYYFESEAFENLISIAERSYDVIILKTKIFQSDTAESGFISGNTEESVKRIRNLNDGNYPLLTIQHYVSLIVTYYKDFAKTLYENYYKPEKSAVLTRVDETFPKNFPTSLAGEPYVSEDDNLFLFDLLGGYYIQNHEVREKYLIMRKELIEKLSELSYERKFGYIKGIREANKIDWDLLGKLI